MASFRKGKPKLSDYGPEIKAMKKAGYVIVDRMLKDYGYTLGLVFKRKKQFRVLMLRECFYDTNKEGQRTKWHGVIDIRDSLWSKALRS